MDSRLFTAVIIALVAVFDYSHGAHFILTAPSELHYDAEYLVTVTATGITTPETVQLEYTSHNRKSHEPINHTEITFDKDGSQSWGVSFTWSRMQELDETMVDLTMITLRNNNKKTKALAFSRRSGYIFIQTDKPLYTPRQTVKFRLLAVDEYQQLSKYPLKVDIMNDKGIVVDRMRYTAEDAFKAQEFELPREAPSGIWSITAAYEGQDNSYSTKQTVTFEVKEYVLPQFESTLKINVDVITRTTNWIVIDVDSKYVYGRPVIGMAELRLGVWDPEDGSLEYLDYHVYEPLVYGKLKKDIRISRYLPRGSDFYRVRHLYVSVNITEAGTLENNTIIDSSTFIAHPYYELDYSKSKASFKPGFPFVFKMGARARSSRPASWLKAYVIVNSSKMVGGELRSTFLTNGMLDLDGNGELQWTIDAPADAEKLVFKTLILNLRQAYVVYEHEVPRFQSENNQYLYLSLEKEVKRDRDGVVLLRYTPPRGEVTQEAAERITVIVMAKGQVLYSTSTVRNLDGRSTVQIPRKYYWDLTPMMRVVAYFNSSEETVTDSLIVDTNDICLEELELYAAGGIFGRPLMIEPKDKYTLEVHGGPLMRVGLVAVDEAVYLLNDKKTLTRESMFEQLGSHDGGTANGDGQTNEDVFKNSGLMYMSVSSSHIDEYEGLGRVIVGDRVRTTGPSLWDFDAHRLVDFESESGPRLAPAPPHTVRKYFPESWLFEEFRVPGHGVLNVNTTMPDSLTTWSFMAVGISAMRGVCVSKPHRATVEKIFFVDVRMPFKVTRLEVVKVRVAIYNFREDTVEVYGEISGDGVCFPTETLHAFNDNSTKFSFNIERRSTKGKEIKLIPLRNGELTIRVDVAVKNDPTRDVVERKLYVEAEGRRIRKSITFVLDPEGKHSTYQRKRHNKIVLSKTPTVSNLVDVDTKQQETKIDLALPEEVIRGTERCRIAAFGDLMGDIINHAVIQSRSLMDQPVLDAEEVLGDLGPTVHALIYANQSGLLDDSLAKKGKRFVQHAVARLLNYMVEKNAFSLKRNSKPATWLTAFVVKTLCHATSLASIDKKEVIDTAFNWLKENVQEDGSLLEQDWRLANDSFEYRLMLSADVLIALKECENKDKPLVLQEQHASSHLLGANRELDPDVIVRLELEAQMAFFLEENLNAITHPMILAKAAYALNLFDSESEVTETFVNILLARRKKNAQGQTYWAYEDDTDDSESTPFWYHKGAHASAIEGTAFALMLFLDKPGANVDAIADWLVAQRNENGAFVGATDSTAAIQALSMYSMQKHGIEVDLLCNVTSFQIKEYKHSFKFTEQNAMMVESVKNVPVGKVLEVITKGQGLGQMQVNVEYNVPVDKNQYCPFFVEVELKPAEAKITDLYKDPLCLSCQIGCPEEEPEFSASLSDTYNIDRGSDNASGHILRRRQRDHKKTNKRRQERNKRRRKNKKNKSRKSRKTREVTYNIRQHPAASKKVVCFHICLEHLLNVSSGPTIVDIEMLSGYNPVEVDWKKISEVPNVRGVEYLDNEGILRIHFYKIDHGNKTCLGFRAKDDMEVGRPSPASVIIKHQGVREPVCALEYKPPQNSESLQVYCAAISNNHRGECRCYSGLCGECRPHRFDTQMISITELREMSCKSDIIYQLKMGRWKDQNQWFEINAEVLAVNRTKGTHQVGPGDKIKMQTPSSCYCPIGEYLEGQNQTFFLLSSDVDRLIDHKGNPQYRYLIDHRSRILRVSEPGQFTSTDSSGKPTVHYEFLRAALGNC